MRMFYDQVEAIERLLVWTLQFHRESCNLVVVTGVAGS